MQKFILFIFLLASVAGFAQSGPGVVKGILEDGTSDKKQPLEDATVSIMSSKDSSLISFTLTSNSGYFEIKNLAVGDYYLMVSYQGFEPLKKSFAVTAEKPVADLSVLKMLTAVKTLEGVTVTDMTPIKIKGDTVEFNAGAFKTKPNANVEDLLKKLPGVQVEKDGTVKAQGEDVQKVYVDGKEFFGSDPKLATKNLAADMVESVQVYDDMSEQAKFTRIDDGSRAKAINIKLKKDKKNGLFGRGTAGYGTKDRYDASFNVNRFKGSRQISLIGAANNVNKQGFSFSDVISSMGGLSGMQGGGMMGGGMSMGGRVGGMMMGGGMGGFSGGAGAGGIATNLSMGINYRDTWSPKAEGNGSLFFSQTGNDRVQNTYRQTFLSDDTTYYNRGSSRSKTQNQNIRFNFRTEFRIDSMNSILYLPSFTLQHSESNSTDSSMITMGGNDKTQKKVSSSQNRNSNERDGFSLNQNLLWRHRFQRSGRTLTVGWVNALNQSKGAGQSWSPLTYYDPSTGNPMFTREQDQENRQRTNSNNNTLTSSYTEPIGRNKIVELNYAYSNNHSTSNRETFYKNPATGKHDLVSVNQTNNFDNRYQSNRFGANYRVQERKYNYQLGMAAQLGEQENHSRRAVNGFKDSVTRQRYMNLFPTASFTYNFKRAKSLRINYRGRTNQPGVSQLQPVVDSSNVLYISMGNPNLRQEFSNNLSIGYNTYNMIAFRYFATNLNFSQTSGKIVNHIRYLPNGAQVIRPENMNGSYNGSAFMALGMPIKGLKGLNINLNTSGMYNHDVSRVTDQRNKTQDNFSNTFIFTQSAGINYSYKEKLDLGISAAVTHNSVTYKLQQNNNLSYLTQSYSFDASYMFKHNFTLASDFDLFLNSGQSQGFNQRIPMWNASFAKQFLKAKQMELKFSVNDILNQNQSVTRNNGINYVEDVQTNVLRRFFMLSLTYKINRMGGKNMFQVPKMVERITRDIRIE